MQVQWSVTCDCRTFRSPCSLTFALDACIAKKTWWDCWQVVLPCSLVIHPLIYSVCHSFVSVSRFSGGSSPEISALTVLHWSTRVLGCASSLSFQCCRWRFPALLSNHRPTRLSINTSFPLPAVAGSWLTNFTKESFHCLQLRGGSTLLLWKGLHFIRLFFIVCVIVSSPACEGWIGLLWRRRSCITSLRPIPSRGSLWPKAVAVCRVRNKWSLLVKLHS